MKKLIKKIVVEFIVASLLLNPLIIYAQASHENILPENNLCADVGQRDKVLLGFFNGVDTTPQNAKKGKDRLEKLYGKTSPKGDVIQYEVFYNYTYGLDDFVETFRQRFTEKARRHIANRYELFFGALKGDDAWWDASTAVSPGAKLALKEFRDYYIKNVLHKRIDPRIERNYAEHRVKLDDFILKGYKLLLVAHSQGNLFANHAYNYATNQLGNNKSIRLVHIAPASTVTNGSHVLADKDIVINGLRAFGDVPAVNVTIPNYFPKSKNQGRDFLGHGLIETYLNTRITEPLQKTSQYINNAFHALDKPEVKISNGFFTVIMKWDGEGDVDLHIKEPDGTQVFWRDKQGNVGFLDLDNTKANGPEHYYASCDKTKLQTGIYQIGVANFRNANGRIATVWVMDKLGNIKKTNKIKLAEETGINSINLLNVMVRANYKGNKFNFIVTTPSIKL